MASDISWRRQGNCWNNPDLIENFFRKWRRGMAICWGTAEGSEECPVRLECLEYAYKEDMLGVWGGTTRKEREMRVKEEMTRK